MTTWLAAADAGAATIGSARATARAAARWAKWRRIEGRMRAPWAVRPRAASGCARSVAPGRRPLYGAAAGGTRPRGLLPARVLPRVELPPRDLVGQVRLALRRLGVVVRVRVALAVAQLLHELRRRVADDERRRQRAALLDLLHHRAVRHVGRVRLGRERQVHDD